MIHRHGGPTGRDAGPSTMESPRPVADENRDRRRAIRYPGASELVEVGWCEHPEVSVDDLAAQHLGPEELAAWRQWAKASGMELAAPEAQHRPSGSPEDPHFRWHQGVLVDLSLLGAAVLIDTLPDGVDVWLRVKSAGRVPWFRATVLGGEPTPRGPHMLRVEFEDSCPYEILSAVAFRRRRG